MRCSAFYPRPLLSGAVPLRLRNTGQRPPPDGPRGASLFAGLCAWLALPPLSLLPSLGFSPSGSPYNPYSFERLTLRTSPRSACPLLSSACGRDPDLRPNKTTQHFHSTREEKAHRSIRKFVRFTRKVPHNQLKGVHQILGRKSNMTALSAIVIVGGLPGPFLHI